MYLPNIVNARHVDTYMVGPLLVTVFTDCEARGYVQYAHVLFVHVLDPQAPFMLPEPMFAVAAEISQFSNSDAHFLGVFPGHGHLNLGSSPDWADLSKFTRRALQVVGEHFNINSKPVRLHNTDD